MRHILKAQPVAAKAAFEQVEEGIQNFLSVEQAVHTLESDTPIFVLYPHVIETNTKEFIDGFAGRVLFAVKANPHPVVLKAIWRAGVRDFDVASTYEAQYVKTMFPSARLFFMHPVKSREAIRKTYALGVRDFAFDCEEELTKIIKETGGEDINLYLRVRADNKDAAYDLSGKFGATANDAIYLLQKARDAAQLLGVTFHVGSQCMNPAAYEGMLDSISAIIDASGVDVDTIDVGGGFPVAYPGLTPQPLSNYFDRIEAKIKELGLDNHQIYAEPGRALTAAGGSTLVRVEMRRGQDLYLNDGVYGSLFDAGFPGWRFPVKLLSNEIGAGSQGLAAYRFYGPTCDSLDKMEGPFLLPENVSEQDWIEVGNLGAYGQAMATRFNGFFSEVCVTISGEPICSEIAEVKSPKKVD